MLFLEPALLQRSNFGGKLASQRRSYSCHLRYDDEEKAPITARGRGRYTIHGGEWDRRETGVE